MRKIFLSLFCLTIAHQSFGKELKLLSPDKKTEMTIAVNQGIKITINHRTQELMSIDGISLNIEGWDFGPETEKVKKVKTTAVNNTLYPPIREKYKEIHEVYNELHIDFKSEYSLIVRVYNDGVAYRFHTSFKDSIVVMNEQLSLNFNGQDSIYFQRSKSFNSSYETPYEHLAVTDLGNEEYYCLPALVKNRHGINVLITESDLVDYPGLWLQGNNSASLISTHPGFPETFNHDGNAYEQGQVKRHAPYIAKTAGQRNFPWRVFIISENDVDLLTNTLVYQLSEPTKIEDTSWIKPGVVTFDWWGRRSIYGVDFKSGINTATAKYFIDFASEFGFEYFLFDDGWSKQDDLFAIHPDLDMNEVMAYARKKQVKIMLWAIWNTFEKQKQRAWDQFEKWGISGIKFDFMNRDDQKMVRFYHEVAQEAAKRKIVIDFHGAYKPAGLRRMYPNVLTREALIEFEYSGWTKHVTPEHDNILPYIRMVTGPMDYIPYTTHNAQKNNFRPVGDIPMGQGTRAHSIAQFVIFESPMQMLPDSPSDYYRERECTEFVSKLPVEWDDLKVLEGKVGKHTVLARKNGDNWYVGAITNWNAKSFEIKFEFLDDGQYHIEYIEDGINAGTRAIDYLKKTATISKDQTMTIKLAPGGGWVARLSKIN